MIRCGMAPAAQVAAMQLDHVRHEFRLVAEPQGKLADHLGPTTVLADLERVGPSAARQATTWHLATDVDCIAWNGPVGFNVVDTPLSAAAVGRFVWREEPCWDV